MKLNMKAIGLALALGCAAGLGAQGLPPELSSARWFNDEYSLDVKPDGGMVMYYTFGSLSGELRGKASTSDGKRIKLTWTSDKLKGDFDLSFGQSGMTLLLVKNPADPKATLSLVGVESPFILWNKASFVPAGTRTTIGDVQVITAGNQLSATTDNLRVRVGPGTGFEPQIFTYRDPQGRIQTFTSILEGTNLRILARTVEKAKVETWNNYWYYIEYKEPLGTRLVYKNGWCYGEFINQMADDRYKIVITSPENQESIYSTGVEVTGRVSGNPSAFKVQVKNPYGNVIAEEAIKPDANGDFTLALSKEAGNFFIGSNTLHFQARYAGNQMTQAQLTFFAHEYQGERAKPVIYLYPRVATKISVKVSPSGGLTRSEPAYGQGWTVIAQPDGRLRDQADGRQWPYLFWESRATSSYQGDEGFIVKTAELGPFLVAKLALLGLNPSEIRDCTDFWLPILDKAPYYRIYFYDRATIDREAPLQIDPKPDTVIRVYFDPKPLEAPTAIREQILEPAVRSGFTVVEWGGARY